MKPIDTAKVVLLLLGIGIWLVGYRLDNRALTFAAMACVIAAFLLRFVKAAPPASPP
jgi:membrane-associated PAP2 superfamily phosphatase